MNESEMTTLHETVVPVKRDWRITVLISGSGALQPVNMV